MGLSKGNPGALKCLLGIVEGDAEKDAIIIMVTIEHLEIYGNDLYVLFSDLARKDYKMMGHLCKTVPGALLKKASSQQDYSGIAMIQDYIDSIEVVT
tara:strand:- start:174 stop:464 length:291 start_codon:yes stop_codon:yes gene_type:complete